MKAIASNGVEINTGDAVLVRNRMHQEWNYALFSHYKEETIASSYCFAANGNGWFKYCIPYSGNEHLVGTTDDYVIPKKEKKSLTYKEKQERWIKKHNIKIGDKVRIIKSSYRGDNDWNIEWTNYMDKFVGKTAKIICIDEDSIKLNTGGIGYYYPYHILEKVEDKFEFKFGAKVKFIWYGEEKEGILTNYTNSDDPEPYFVTWLNENSGIGRTSKAWVNKITYID